MIYIHTLKGLNQKTAEIESVGLLRTLKTQTPYPFTSGTLSVSLSNFTLDDTTVCNLQKLMPIIDGTIKMFEEFIRKKDPVHELINITRARQALIDNKSALQTNIAYLQTVAAWQKQWIPQLTDLFNALPKLQTAEQKQVCNEYLNNVFGLILRNDSFIFKWDDLIHEGKRDTMIELEKSISQGYLFHKTLEEDIKKQEWNTIQLRISPPHLQESQTIQQNFNKLRTELRYVYDQNMKMVELAVILYTYIKWLKNGV